MSEAQGISTIIEVANSIHRRTLRGANWIVMSPEVASIFETVRAGFAPAPCETFISERSKKINWQQEGF